MTNTRFNYRYDDTSTQKPVDKVYDLTDERVTRALSWIVGTIKADSYDVKPRLAVYQDLPDSAGIPGTVLTREGNVLFKVPAAIDRDDLFRDGWLEFDLRQCVEDPRMAALALILFGNLAITNVPAYTEPIPVPGPSAVPDWKQPGARIGAPLESTPGWFQYRFDGGSVGDVWTGVSGQKYQLAWCGSSFTFARWLGWKLVV
jgi:hypothetical protein